MHTEKDDYSFIHVYSWWSSTERLKVQMLLHRPTVAEVPGWKEPSQNLRRSEVFPTLEFPTRMTLKRRSGSEAALSS